MSAEAEINIFAALDFIRDNAPFYAKAKADRVYLEEYRKTKKALCMREAELKGAKASNTQEREAYAHPEYLKVIEGLRDAVEAEEKLRWLFVAAEARIEAWRTMESTRRIEAKTL